jgi:hypothetical protein
MEDTITIEKAFLDHLLSCLANQKFINESPPNGDAAAMEPSEYQRIQRENQRVIDAAFEKGMDLLHPL